MMHPTELLTQAAELVNDARGIVCCCPAISDVVDEAKIAFGSAELRARNAFDLLRPEDATPSDFWWPLQNKYRNIRVLALLFAAAIASGCATQPPMARVIEWYPTPDPAYRCAHPQPEDPVPQRVVMMRGGCLWILSEAQVGIITSSTDTSYSDLGAMLRRALEGK